MNTNWIVNNTKQQRHGWNVLKNGKYYFLFFAILVACIYALPNLYGESPAIQIVGLRDQGISADLVKKVRTSLSSIEADIQGMEESKEQLLIKFKNTEKQLEAKDTIDRLLGDNYSIALNLTPNTPSWLRFLGAHPMKLGLDLRGGVHFLIEVDLSSAMQRRLDSYYTDIRTELRQANIHYGKVLQKPEEILVEFDENSDRDNAQKVLQKRFAELATSEEKGTNSHILKVRLMEAFKETIQRDTMEQTLVTLRKRVNELGVSEALVQRRGVQHIIIELPGIQDTARARDLLGKTATLQFMLEDHENFLAWKQGRNNFVGSRVYYDRANRPVLLKKRVILTGDTIIGATTGSDYNGRPAVNIRIGGNINLFKQTTRDNIGKRMGVVYVEAKDKKLTEQVISVATIQSALGNDFQITGLSFSEARDLALLLRSGALPVPLSIVEEGIVGPSVGQDNIRMGVLSAAVGLAIVLVFMTLYYHIFGIIANVALLANLVLLVALMSLIDATLTLPGIAGIVLTLGMAVDANVLIFERIREELRMGASPLTSIRKGFEGAFSTIIDSNLTTLIAGLLLFLIGTGPVKGFAVTLSLGILTSMFTAIVISRAIINFCYDQKLLKQVWVGI